MVRSPRPGLSKALSSPGSQVLPRPSLRSQSPQPEWISVLFSLEKFHFFKTYFLNLKRTHPSPLSRTKH